MVERRSHRLVAAVALRESTRGNLQPLIGRVRSGRPLTEGEREFIARFLDAHDGRRGAAYLRRVEQMLIRSRVEGLVREEGMKREAAVRIVMNERGVSRSTVLRRSRQLSR